MVGLISPSGAGKTTMLNIAGLLDKPSFGAIQVAGKTVFDFTDTFNRNRYFGQRNYQY